MIDTRLPSEARRGNTEAVLLLLDECPPEYLSEGLYLATLWAAVGNHPGLIQALLSRGADVNSAHHRGHRILSEAAKAGSLDAVKLLLASGADVTARDTWGHTALDYARRYKREEVLRVLEGAGAAE